MQMSKVQAKYLFIQSLIGGLALVTLFVFLGILGGSGRVQAQDNQPAITAPIGVFTETLTTTVHLPIIANDFGPTADRIGFGATAATFPPYSIIRYPLIRSLMAGWYTDWSAAFQPARPNGIEYVQMVRVHQKLACGDYYNADRSACPYAQPLDYVALPDVATVQAIAAANPGSIWLIGNEMDRVDFSVCAETVAGKCTKFTSLGQDEIIPETYARVYHDVYTAIKAVDPTARVAIGGVIQPTPLRLQWLTIAWDSYKSTYGADMPVDIWNVHNFILREVREEYGADIPAGLPGNPTVGAYSKDDRTHVDKTIFDQQIRAMRQWMKDRGQQEKPLVITEYGVLYSHCVKKSNGTCDKDLGNEAATHDFMLWTFDYFLNTSDCALGYTADGCRLVQRWLWFSLDDVSTLANGSLSFSANPHTSLFDKNTLQLRSAGEKFRQYVQDHYAELAK